jgi:hypothetical protein
MYIPDIAQMPVTSACPRGKPNAIKIPNPAKKGTMI